MTVDTVTGEITRDDPRPQLPISTIVVSDRARQDDGDLTDLMESIREHGLLQPIGVLPGNRLLFGGRRLEACRRLGMTAIPITRPQTRDDAIAQLKAERDENTCRKEMTMSELVAIGQRIEELEKPKAVERQVSQLRQGNESPSGPRGPNGEAAPTRRTSEVVGEALGMSRRTYDRAKAVVEATSSDDPEIRTAALEAVKEMDETGKVRPAEYKVRAARKPIERPKAPPKYGGNRRKHLQVIDAMTNSLAGVVITAREITELDSTVTREEAARLKGDLSKQITALRGLNSLLEERSK